MYTSVDTCISVKITQLTKQQGARQTQPGLNKNRGQTSSNLRSDSSPSRIVSSSSFSNCVMRSSSLMFRFSNTFRPLHTEKNISQVITNFHLFHQYAFSSSWALHYLIYALPEELPICMADVQLVFVLFWGEVLVSWRGSEPTRQQAKVVWNKPLLVSMPTLSW